MKIESTDKTYPESEPKKEDYDWWQFPDYDPSPCEDLGWDDCRFAYKCSVCKKGYPVGDPDTHYSQQYKCRCYDYTPYPSGDEEE